MAEYKVLDSIPSTAEREREERGRRRRGRGRGREEEKGEAHRQYLRVLTEVFSDSGGGDLPREFGLICHDTPPAET
jgi:hypothetical protein